MQRLAHFAERVLSSGLNLENIGGWESCQPSRATEQGDTRQKESRNVPPSTADALHSTVPVLLAGENYLYSNYDPALLGSTAVEPVSRTMGVSSTFTEAVSTPATLSPSALSIPSLSNDSSNPETEADLSTDNATPLLNDKAHELRSRHNLPSSSSTVFQHACSVDMTEISASCFDLFDNTAQNDVATPVAPDVVAREHSSVRSAQLVAALHRATAKGQSNIITILLEKGVEVDARDECGKTPLIISAENGNVDSMETLLAYGADPCATDSVGVSAILAAIEAKQEAAVRLLVNKLCET